MKGIKMLQLVGSVATLVGFAANFVSNKCDKAEMAEQIKKEAAKAVAEALKNKGL